MERGLLEGATTTSERSHRAAISLRRDLQTATTRAQDGE
jgi:hypothetical protein